MKNYGKGIVLFILLAVCVSTMFAKTSAKGNLIGFIYDQDGTTPIQGAVMMIKNLDTGVTFKSSPTDNSGAFKIPGLDIGLYVLGVSTQQGNFNTENLIGIAGNETAKVSLSLVPEPEINVDDKAPRLAGEKLLGRVIGYDANANQARIHVLRGELQENDNIHFYSDPKLGKTDFWQDAKIILQNGIRVKKVLKGQDCIIRTEKPAIEGDWIYKKKKGLVAFFTSPIGIVTILAGGIATYVTLESHPVASQYRQK